MAHLKIKKTQKRTPHTVSRFLLKSKPARPSDWRHPYLFDGEVVDQVVVVFVEAAVQRDTVRVKEQVLRREESAGKLMRMNE